MVAFGTETRVRFIGGELVFRVEGLQEMILTLDNMVRRSSNLSNPFQRFQKHWFEAIEENFDAGGDPIDWPALSPAYESWKSRRYPGQPIMRATDALFESVTSATSDTIWQVGPRSIQFGSRLPYFDYHQEGRGRNPYRPIIVLPGWAQQKLFEMVNRYIETGKAE